MSTPIIYSNNQYVAVKHSFMTVPENINMSLTSFTNLSSGNAMTIVNGNVGIGTTNPRQLLDIQGGNTIISGNIGIGTTIPLYNLHINGTISAATYNNIPISYLNILNVETFKTLTAGTTRTLNWTLPTSFTNITFEMWAGGGGGGGNIYSGGYNGSGGEGGDYTKITLPYTVFTGISTLTLTIGAGGTGGPGTIGVRAGNGQTTSIIWGGGVYSIQAFGGQGGIPMNTSATTYNFSQKTYTNRNTYDIIIPGGYGGAYDTNSTFINGTNNSITTGINHNYNGTGGGGSRDGNGGPGGSNYVIADAATALGTGKSGENAFSSIEMAIYGGAYTYIVGGGGGSGGVGTGNGKNAGPGGYPGGGGGGTAYYYLVATGAGKNGGDGLIRITWY